MRLIEIAYARSGDKGSSANIGVAARYEWVYPILRDFLTAQRVREYFSDVCRGDVDRYELPNLRALNFVLHEILDGGGAGSLRLDPQGKTLCDSLMAMELDPDTAERVTSQLENDGTGAR
jgi:hypothetical protein